MATKNLNLLFNNQDEFGVGHRQTGELIRLSVRYGWSSHSCACQNISKTGLVLYPSNTDYKNIVLLVCEKCYGYNKSNGLTQHKQLADWYYGIYGDKKSYSFTSGFSIKADGQLGFNSTTFNAMSRCPYHTDNRTMGKLEQDVIQQVVLDKLDSYTVTP